MIRIQKGEEPKILSDNKVQWTDNLMALVRQYGSYSQIPLKEKNAAISHYNHEDISNALKGNSGKAKCVYCESYVDVTCYANIEHYHPKSIYPDETFCWDNLFIGCTRCNNPKDNFDTKNEPFIHPVKDDPEEFLTFDDLLYVPRYKEGIAYQKAKNVIDKCALHGLRLFQVHAKIEETFLKSREVLAGCIKNYKAHKREDYKISDAIAIYENILCLKEEASDDALYAGFMRYLLRKCCEVREAVMIINQHKRDLGLSSDFDWGFGF